MDKGDIVAVRDGSIVGKRGATCGVKTNPPVIAARPAGNRAVATDVAGRGSKSVGLKAGIGNGLRSHRNGERQHGERGEREGFSQGQGTFHISGPPDD